MENEICPSVVVGDVVSWFDNDAVPPVSGIGEVVEWVDDEAIRVYDERLKCRSRLITRRLGDTWKLFTGQVFREGTLLVEEPSATEPAHYKKFAIEPLEFILKNELGFCEANVVKYVCRWQDKGGVVDLKKAREYLDRLITHQESK